MRYTVVKSIIEVVGGIWMPYGATCAQDVTCSASDVENMRNDAGEITRESVALWLDSHAGDFSSIADFHASLEIGEESVEIPWQSEESELTYGDCMFGDD